MCAMDKSHFTGYQKHIAMFNWSLCYICTSCGYDRLLKKAKLPKNINSSQTKDLHNSKLSEFDCSRFKTLVLRLCEFAHNFLAAGNNSQKYIFLWTGFSTRPLFLAPSTPCYTQYLYVCTSVHSDAFPLYAVLCYIFYG